MYTFRIKLFMGYKNIYGATYMDGNCGMQVFLFFFIRALQYEQTSTFAKNQNSATAINFADNYIEVKYIYR